MQSVKITAVGKLKDKFYSDASEEYLKRLKAYCKCEIIEIPQTVLPDSPAEGEINSALEKEGEQILKKIPSSSLVIAMCIEGKQYSSEKLAKLISDAGVNGKSSLVFIIGGSFGLSEKVKKRADIRISMSEMTFPHRLARVMLLEQIYRAYSINAGTKYHK